VQSELLTAYALMKWAAGEPQAALELARAARDVDPLNIDAAVREADLLAALGRLEAAARLYERVARNADGDARALFGLAEARRRQGRFDEALAARRLAYLAAGDTAFEPLFARARGPAGYDDVVRAAARDDLDRMRARREGGGYVSPLDAARAWAQLGDAEQAFGYLAAALDERSAGLALLDVDPAWDRVRGDDGSPGWWHGSGSARDEARIRWRRTDNATRRRLKQGGSSAERDAGCCGPDGRRVARRRRPGVR